MFADIIDRLKTRTKHKAALRLLRDTKFQNDDIGPINEIGAVDRFVISIPKCASTAIQRGFERIGHRVIHAHNNHTTYDAFANGDLLRKQSIGLETLIQIRRRLSAEPIHLFFGYREPVSWYLSLAGHFGMPLTEDLRINIAGHLRDTYPWSNYGFAESRQVIERASGLNLLSEAFDTHAGYSILKKGNLHVVLYRFDRMKELETYIRANVDARFEMSRERVNANPDYIDFVNRFRIPAATLRALHGDAIFSHFYDRDEAEQLFSRYAEPQG